MKKQLLSQLRELREHSTAINPSKEWVASNREQLVSQISNTVADDAARGVSTQIQQIFRIFLPAKQLHALRGVFVFLLVFGLATSGLVVSASPLPRDIVFNVKVAAATMTGNTEAKGKLHLEEAKHQTQELQRKLAVVSEEPKEKTKKDVEKQLKKIKKQVDSAKKTLEKAKETAPESATVLAKELTIETTVISESLKEVTAKVAEDTPVEETEVVDELQKEVVEIRKEVVDAGIDALGVLVGPNHDLPEEEAKAIETVVEEKIGELLEQAEEVAKAVEETKEQAAAQAEDSPAVDSNEAGTYIDPTTSSVDVPVDVNPTSSTPSSSTVDVIVEDIKVLEEKSEKTEVVAEQVKVLLEENQVNRAVEYLKELSQNTLETEEAVNETKQKIELQEEQEKEAPAVEEAVDVKMATPTEAVADESNKGAEDTSL